ncbi:hypothetical protein GCG54_00007205 [Colletotrichum gloeosporioides]|uniref:Uncharacterized protein n=1 Tax=Colletotrichum gloeosporioides TaxID=474922 RepID=A0A8H4CN02_COLGL|nr:uncharacterized protein GCG54_00007205 [Colletotrichum gloeosporioides]KAF3806953.1 hypothetical protein GCG54_00007205 [Colletotrichum gloeosporioides]
MKPFWLALVIADLTRSSSAILQYSYNILPSSTTSSTLLSASETSSSFELKPYTDNDDCRPVKQSYLIANWYCALYVKFDHHLIRIYDDQHVKQFEFVITHYRCVFLKFNLSAVDKFHFIKQRQFRASQLDAYCIAYFFKLEYFFGFEYFFKLWYCLANNHIFIGIDRLYNNALFKHNISSNLCRRVADYAFGGTDNIPESYIRWFLFDFQHPRYLLIGNDGRTS